MGNSTDILVFCRVYNTNKMPWYDMMWMITLEFEHSLFLVVEPIWNYLQNFSYIIQIQWYFTAIMDVPKSQLSVELPLYKDNRGFSIEVFLTLLPLVSWHPSFPGCHKGGLPNWWHNGGLSEDDWCCYTDPCWLFKHAWVCSWWVMIVGVVFYNLYRPFILSMSSQEKLGLQ